jgi:hypothetical protein
MAQRNIIPGVVSVVDGQLRIVVGKRVGAISREQLTAFVHRTDVGHRRDSVTGEWVFFTATQVLRFGADVVAYMRGTTAASTAPTAKRAVLATKLVSPAVVERTIAMGARRKVA